jgi:hypothetical protein
LRVRIRNYIGIARADIEIGPGTTLIAGDNAQGKTSILRAVATLVTGDLVPRGMRLNAANELVMDGRADGELRLTANGDAGNASASVGYPEPKYVTQGKPPQASAIAAGISNYTDLTEVERARFLANLLQTMPGDDAVKKALAGEIGTGDVQAVLDMLHAHSWDEVCEKLKERRIKLKGKWEDLAGERYGDSKAKEWKPKGWEEGHDEQSPEQISARLATAQEAVEHLTRAAVLSEAEYQSLVDLVGKREPMEMALQMAQTQMPTIEAEWALSRQELDALPPEVEEGLPCPHCGAFVVIAHKIGDQPLHLKPVEPLAPGEPERRREALQAKREEVAEAHRKLEQQQRLIGACMEKLREIDTAQDKLRGAKKGNGEDHVWRLRAAQEARDKAQASAARSSLLRDARKASVDVAHLNTIIDVLGPQGLRRDALEAKLAQFEAENLLPLTHELATWKAVTIDRDTLMPRYGGRPYVLCSRSEQWRVNVTLQVAIALLQGDSIICIDGADILSKKGQTDLFTGLLDRLPIPVVVGAMYDRPKDAPGLASAGLGHVYWIKDGEVTA